MKSYGAFFSECSTEAIAFFQTLPAGSIWANISASTLSSPPIISDNEPMDIQHQSNQLFLILFGSAGYACPYGRSCLMLHHQSNLSPVVLHHPQGSFQAQVLHVFF